MTTYNIKKKLLEFTLFVEIKYENNILNKTNSRLTNELFEKNFDRNFKCQQEES